MNLWKTEILRIIKILLGNAGKASEVEMAVCLAAALIGIFLAFTWTGRTFGATMAETGRVSAVIALGIVLGLAAFAAVDIYAVPQIKNAMVAAWLPLAASVLAILAIVIPAACFLMKGKYFSIMFAMLLSIAAAFGVVLLVHGAFEAMHEGDKGFKKTKERTDIVNDMLKK